MSSQKQEISPRAPSLPSNSSKLAEIRSAVQKLGCTVEGIDDATFLRFLRARSMNTDKAAAMFVNHQKWRASFVPLGYIPDAEVASELAAEKFALQGKSKKGLPLILCFASKHHRAASEDVYHKFCAHVLDKAIASAPPGIEKLMVVVDMNNLGFRNLDIKGFIEGFRIVQDYYPERLGKLFMINVPYIFMAVWKLLSSFLDKATLEKMAFLSSEATPKVLLSEVDAHVLPTIYGGEADIILFQNARSPQESLAGVTSL